MASKVSIALALMTPGQKATVAGSLFGLGLLGFLLGRLFPTKGACTRRLYRGRR